MGPSSPRKLSRRIHKYSSRAFYITVLLFGAICLLSFVSGPHRARSDQSFDLVARDFHTVKHEQTTDNSVDCHLVRQMPDQCNFVRTHCPDEEAGLFSYLELYYCDLRHAKPVAFTIIVLWLGMLFSTIGIAASDFFCINLSTIASLLGMSESLAGVTFLAFGNGSPDVFSTFAAMGSKSGSLAVGELIGAAGFITAVVAGSMAVVRPFKVAKRSFVRDVGFFIVAAGFSMVFLKDGKLYLWECASMVAFYAFYVAFVVGWHWWQGRRRRWHETHALARDHYTHGEDVEPVEQYRDDEDLPTSARPVHVSRTTTADDLAALEQGAAAWSDEFSEVPDDTRERWLGELKSNMRLRPQPGRRRYTANPIRPSLVGALEFRAVLAGLQKSRNIQAMPIHLRRYSDDPTFTAAQQSDQLSTISDPPVRSQYDVAADLGASSQDNDLLSVRAAPTYRARAASVNGADNLQYDPESFRRPSELLASLAEQDSNETSRAWNQVNRTDLSTNHLADPTDPSGQTLTSQPHLQVSITPPASEAPSRNPSFSFTPTQDGETTSLLVSSNSKNYGSTSRPELPPNRNSHSPGTLPTPQNQKADESMGPGDHKNMTLELPKLQIPGVGTHIGRSSPTSPFPVFNDDSFRIRTRSSTIRSRSSSFRLPPPGDEVHSLETNGQLKNFEESDRSPYWWPYFLPAPSAIGSVLFPTLCGWREKNIWEKALGIVAAPSVFCLAITLPVVEAENMDLAGEDHRMPTLSLPPTPFNEHGPQSGKSKITILEPDEETEDDMHAHADSLPPMTHKSIAGHGDTAMTAVSAEFMHVHARHSSEVPLLSPGPHRQFDSPKQIPSTPTALDANEDKDWNRWLLMIHCFTSPLFCILIIFANFYDNFDWTGKTLLKMSLYTMVGSLVCLAIVLLTSTPTRPPQWRTFICFIGFCVSIAWISTVANEVVGVLKAVGVILNMSDAILGLTIFAVGNSLGDFVADVTVARLGFPVMALSACFGGPMLNILLGIGLSGMYFTIKHAQAKQHRHPDDPVKFKPFHVDVSGTLLISGATLLVTLIVLLILVPIRRWRMDRVVGLTVIGIWVASTIVNVVIEVLGLSDKFGPGS